MMPSLVCVLRSGGEYKPEHVLRLYEQVRDAGPWMFERFVCLTDQRLEIPIVTRPLTRGWPGWWSKLELCAPENNDLGDILYIDLDTTVTGSLEDIARVRRLTLLSDFLRPTLLASGVMRLPVAARERAWELLHRTGAETVMRSFKRKGDQGFFHRAWFLDAARWQDLLPGQLVSFKEHVEPSGYIVPWDARIICYHGHPRPWEVACD